METERLPTNLLFRSFLIVAGSYVASVIFLFLTYFITTRVGFPETFEFMSTPNLSIEQMQTNAELVLPSALFWIVLCVHSMFCVGLGWVVTRVAPYAKFNHAIFVAVVIFVSCLQTAVKTSGDIQRMTFGMMCVFPIAILIGAKIHGSRPST